MEHWDRQDGIHRIHLVQCPKGLTSPQPLSMTCTHLPCCVPYCELASLVVDIQLLGPEVNACTYHMQSITFRSPIKSKACFPAASCWLSLACVKLPRCKHACIPHMLAWVKPSALWARQRSHLPIVEVVFSRNLSWVNLVRMQLFPTPESPMRRICAAGRQAGGGTRAVSDVVE